MIRCNFQCRNMASIPYALYTKLCIILRLVTGGLNVGTKYHGSFIIKIIIPLWTSDINTESRREYAKAQARTKDCNPNRTDTLPAGVLLRRDFHSPIMHVDLFSRRAS